MTAPKKKTQKTGKENRISLRDVAVGALADLRAGRITPQAAAATAHLLGKVWAGERLALDYYDAKKRNSKIPRLAFIDVSTTGGA